MTGNALFIANVALRLIWPLWWGLGPAALRERFTRRVRRTRPARRIARRITRPVRRIVRRVRRVRRMSRVASMGFARNVQVPRLKGLTLPKAGS